MKQWLKGWSFDLQDQQSRLDLCKLLCTLYLIIDLTEVTAALSPCQKALRWTSCETFFHVSVRVPVTIGCTGYQCYSCLKNTLKKTGFALRQDVLPMLCVNFIWPLSTKNVPMSCGSGCRYENVRLQQAVMYTRGEGEGSACGGWPAEAPDVQRCLGLVLCCKCVVRSRLPDTHWGIWAADDGLLFPACKINCRLLRIYNMKMLRIRNLWLESTKEVSDKMDKWAAANLILSTFYVHLNISILN